MNESSHAHWGEWILHRSRIVGFNYQIELAAAVGCTPNQVSRWIQEEQPPEMRKGFDTKLAYTLQTTHEMLFKDWEKTPPEAAKRIMLHADQLPLEEEFLWDPDLQELLRKILPYLAPAEMEWLVLQVALKVLEKKDKRAPLFRQIIDRYKLFEHYERTGERLPTAASIPSQPGEPLRGVQRPVADPADKLAKMERERVEMQARYESMLNKTVPPAVPPPLGHFVSGLDKLHPHQPPTLGPESAGPLPPPIESIRNRKMKFQNPTPKNP